MRIRFGISIGSMLIALLLVPAGAGASQSGTAPIEITVDARAPWKRLIPVTLTMADRSGPLALTFPHWLPGMHGPQGSLGSYGSLTVTSDGAPTNWNRDPFDPYEIHIQTPPGVHTIKAVYEYVSTRRSDEVFYGVASDQDLAIINPSAFALAPIGDARLQPVRLRVSLPQYWVSSSAMASTPVASADYTTLNFDPVSLYTMIDSPIMAGRYHRSIPLATPPGDVPHTLDLYADTDDVLVKKAGTYTRLLTNLVAESGRMFGVRHYRSFHFMVALTNEVGRNGLEHHQGVAYVLQPDDLDDSRKQLRESSWNTMLIPHEFTHSWNGKYRRPYGEDAKSSIAPQSADLIWMYEGLTQYLGDVLMVRSGFRSADSWRNDLLERVIEMRRGGGRDWENLADTAIVAPYTYVQGAGPALRSINDVYYESELIWLEADAIIRTESHGTRSLDDFCRLFFGGVNNGPEIVPYARQDIVETLNKTAKYDWSAFIEKRFYGPPAGLPTEGLEAAGWSFAFADKPQLPERGVPDYRNSFGALIAMTGRVMDVVPHSLADKAGLAAGITVLGANGVLFSPEGLRAAVQATRGRKTPLVLLVSESGRYRTIRIDGVDGERFPWLTRTAGRPDLISAITASTTTEPPASGAKH